MTKRVKRHLFSVDADGANLSADPNDHRDALVEPESICRFMGRSFHEGDQICHLGDVFECRAGDFRPTGGSC